MTRFTLRGAVSLAFAAALCAPQATRAQTPKPVFGGTRDGHDLLQSGKYQEAIAALKKVPASDSDWAASQRDLVRAYAAIGKYDEAEAAGRLAAASTKGAIVWNPLGEVLITRGKRAAAESAFIRARSTPDSLMAALNLAVLHYDRGDRDQAMKEFDKFIDVYNKSLGNDLTSDDLMAVAIACEYLGENDPQLFHDAQKAYDRATTSIHRMMRQRSAWANCFFESTTSTRRRRHSKTFYRRTRTTRARCSAPLAGFKRMARPAPTRCCAPRST